MVSPPTLHAGASVLLVEDDPRTIVGITDAFREAGHQLNVATSLQAAQRSINKNAYDMIVLDLNLPDGNGIDFAGEFRGSGMDTPILMLTAEVALETKLDGFRNGADDYLCKPFAMDELLARMDALLRRSNGAGGRVLSYADLTLDLLTRTAKRGERDVRLSARETDLLAYLIRHADQILSRDELLTDVWQDETLEATNVLNVYINYLRSKLDTDRSQRLIHTVRGVGYLFSSRHPDELLAEQAE